MGANLSLNFREEIDLKSYFENLIEEDISGKIATKKYKKGEFIYLPNDCSTKVYFVDSGRVKVGVYSNNGKELIKHVSHKGELFGEMGILGDQKRKEFAQTMEKSTIYVIPLDMIQSLLFSDVNLNMQLTRYIGNKLLKTQDRLESQLFKDTKTRVVEFLCDLGRNNGQPIGFELLVKQFYTHQEIANFTGASRQTVTTILNELRTENFIYFDRNKLLIRDIEEFSSLVA